MYSRGSLLFADILEAVIVAWSVTCRLNRSYHVDYVELVDRFSYSSNHNLRLGWPKRLWRKFGCERVYQLRNLMIPVGSSGRVEQNEP